MLAEIRRLFSITTLSDTKPLQELIARTLHIQAPCAEASFWQGLCCVRAGDLERAGVALEAARAASSLAHVDPPLYLGALLLRQGQAKQSLKYLTEANRIDGNCPVVTLQLGVAMIAAGGDTQLAVRALQRALGPRGLEMWEQEPRRAWVEGFPEGRWFVRKLAALYAFVCPLWGGDLNVLKQQGNLALAQGLAKLGSAPEAAELYGKVLQNGAPSLIALRGLGLTLARLGKYDEAFKHLRLAHDMEEPHDRVTAGYLALCGAKGKPTHPEDKTRNILWALKVVTRFNAPGDAEWVGLISALFDEALALGESQANDHVDFGRATLFVRAPLVGSPGGCGSGPRLPSFASDVSASGSRGIRLAFLPRRHAPRRSHRTCARTVRSRFRGPGIGPPFFH